MCDVGFFGSCPEVVSWVGVASDRTNHLEVRLRFAYLDQIPDPGRAVAVHCRLSDGRWSRRHVARDEDIGTGVPGASIPEDELDLLGRVLSRAEFDPLILRSVVDLGPRRFLGRADLQLVDGETAAERWGYKDFPKLRVLRMPLPGVDVTFLAWVISEERLPWFASRLERLELESDLLQRMRTAVAESDAAFRRANPHLV